jgi:ribosomal-protein-alanine N-acetyltransferase
LFSHLPTLEVGKPRPEIETAPLTLRQFTAADFDEVAAMRGDAVVMRYIGKGTPQDEQQAKTWLEKNESRWEQHSLGMWAVTPKDEKTLLGWCGLAMLDETDEVEVGYGFAHAHWGKGIASEGARASLRYGFETLGLNRIVAVALPENTASRRVMEKLGMKYEREAYYYSCDVAYYAISRDEFKPDPTPYRLKHPGD